MLVSATEETALVVEGKQFVTRAGDDEPRILDVDFAAWLGYSRPRDVRKLVSRLRADGILNDLDICATVAQNTDPKGRGRPSTAYWLNEAAALAVAAKSEGEKAAALLREVIRVFLLVRRQVLLPSLQAMQVQMSRMAEEIARLQGERRKVDGLMGRNARATVDGNDHALARLREKMNAIATHWAVSFQKVDGHIRRRCRATSYKQLLLSEMDIIMRELDDFLNERLAFPGGKLREKATTRQLAIVYPEKPGKPTA